MALDLKIQPIWDQVAFFFVFIVEETVSNHEKVIKLREAIDECPTLSRLHFLMSIIETGVKWEKSAENAVSLNKDPTFVLLVTFTQYYSKTLKYAKCNFFLIDRFFKIMPSHFQQLVFEYFITFMIAFTFCRNVKCVVRREMKTGYCCVMIVIRHSINIVYVLP